MKTHSFQETKTFMKELNVKTSSLYDILLESYKMKKIAERKI